MKINIFFDFKDGAWGGANQFLKALKDYFISKGIYTNDLENADIILFNSNPGAVDLLIDIFLVKKKNPNILIANRIDGPVYLIRDRNLEIDKIFFMFNEMICDGTIFQSNWSKENCKKLGMKSNLYENTLMNSPDSTIFNCSVKKELSKEGKIKIVSTSWSNNWKKGFAVYKWLDENLDFNRYEMSFIGNTPIKFQNINHLQPMDSNGLANELKKSDIFITASQKDPCSNSLIEALHCGLPSIVFDDGGHPEIVKLAGEVFTKAEEIPKLLEKIVFNYDDYINKIQVPNILDTGLQYEQFLENILNNVKNNNYTSKKFSMSGFIKIIILILKIKVLQKIDGLKRRVLNFKVG